MMLAICTAWPAAPFPRLSVAADDDRASGVGVGRDLEVRPVGAGHRAWVTGH